MQSAFDTHKKQSKGSKSSLRQGPIKNHVQTCQGIVMIWIKESLYNAENNNDKRKYTNCLIKIYLYSLLNKPSKLF